MEIRQYQEDIINDVVTSTDNVLVVAPTGSGKTYIAKRIAQQLSERVLFVTPRIDLVSQTVEVFDGKCDILWGKYQDTGSHITVASRQTLALRDMTFEDWVVILDEVHIGLPTSKKLIDRIRPKRVIGLTATPERTDGLSFIKGYDKKRHSLTGKRWESALFDRVLERVTIQDLQKDGYLANLNYSAAKFNKKLVGIKSSFDELRYSQFQDIVETDEAKVNLSSFLRSHEDQKPFLIFTPDVASAYYWRDEINKFGYNLVAVDGSVKKEDRQKIYDQVKNGEYDGIVNCALLTYGFDMPCAKTVVLIRNIKSRPLYIQVIGRVLRPFKDKEAIVYDMAGSCWNFCSLKQPNLFMNPIKYNVRGFDENEDIQERDRLERVRDLIDDNLLDKFIENPLEVLELALYKYKENFEVELFNAQQKANKKAEELEELVDSQRIALELSDSESKEARETVKRLNKELARTKEALSNSGPVTDPILWFKLPAAFEWFRKSFPNKVLRPLGYDKSKKEELLNNEDWRNEYYRTTLDELPIIVTGENLQYCIKQIDSYSHWWLDHFNLDYGYYSSNPKSNQLDFQKPKVINTTRTIGEEEEEDITRYFFDKFLENKQ